MDTWHLPPPRVLVALGVTVLAVVVLGLRACTGGDDAADDAATTTAPPTSVEATVDTAEVTTTSIVLRPDWYPKQSSRYSDREPVVTVTTLAPTTSTSTTTTRPRSGSGTGSSSGSSSSGTGSGSGGDG